MLYVKSLQSCPTLYHPIERVTSRDARGPQAEEIDCKCETFFFPLLSGRRKQTTSVRLLLPLLIQNLKEVSFKILCCHDNAWFHPNLTFVKPGANRCIFLMEMFFLSLVNEL